ncbi:MAG TPA: PIN domain-containing protein [Opitutaceae bacterium]
MSDPANRSQAVYFDSNILIGASWPFPTAQLLEIVRIAQAADLDVCLPDLVLREVTAHWLRDLQSMRQHLADQVKAFNRDTFGLSEMAPPMRLPKADVLLTRYAKHTKDLTDLFRVVPTKDRPASYYTEMALRRRGAFGEKGKGFHDTIILTGILDDMVEHNYTHAIIVSKDGGFRLDGVKHLANAAKVEITIIESLAALEKPVKEELGAKVVREMTAAKQRVIAMVRTCEPKLIDFLSKALDYTRDPLGAIFNTVSRREFLGFLDYDDAHASDILFKPGPRKDFKFSVDVRVKVRERSEEFRATEALTSLSLGFNSIHAENIVSKTIERAMAVTVEGEADISEKGVETIRFASIRDTKSGGSYASPLAGGA